jgi:two-component system sensor histidine kinase FlrB
MNALPFEEIFEQLPCGLVILNAEGVIIGMNPMATSLLGQDFRLMPWIEVIANVFSPREDDGHEVSLVDGRRVHVGISSLPSLPGELVMLTDLTKSRDYEHEKEGQRRLVAIGRMTAQLAHQIRTPLASARLYTDHLKQFKALDDQRTHQWLDRLSDCHESIETQINDLLSFAKGRQLTLTMTDFDDFITEFMRRVSPVLAIYSIELTLENQLLGVSFPMNLEALMGALLNLIHNAAEAEATTLQLTCRRETDTHFVLILTDNGLGMTEETKSHLFHPFFTTKAQGTGLGLSVVLSVIKQHQGDIQFTTALNQGCCVRMQFAG